MMDDEVDTRVLVDLCTGIIKSYNPLRVTPTTHLEEFVSLYKLDKDHAVFVKEIFFASERYAALLSISLDGLYQKYSSSTSKLDFYMYMVMTLLTLVKMREMGFKQFRKFIWNQEHQKMSTLLNFLCDEDSIKKDGWLEEQWATIYDIYYVRDSLIGTLMEFKPDMDKLRSDLNKSVAPADLTRQLDMERELGIKSNRKRNVTEPIPFQLSVSNKPKEERPQTPIFKPHLEIKEVPDAIYNNTLEQINAQKEERRNINREKTKEHLAFQEFNITETRNKPAKDYSKNIPKFVPNELPESTYVAPGGNMAVKPTVAQILRDEALFRKNEKEIADKMKRFEEQLRDETEYEAWKEKMEALDDEKAKIRQMALKKEMHESREKAKEASERKTEQNHELVLHHRKKAEDAKQIMLLEGELLLEKNRQSKLKVQEDEAKVAIAAQKLQDEKRQEAERLTKEREERTRLQELKAEEEMIKKKELIREIQAMEKLANTRSKERKIFDPSQASGVGLLAEMSVAELQERMTLCKQKQKEQETAMREKIVTEKKEKKTIIEAIARRHQSIRGAKTAKEAERRISEKTATALAVAESRAKNETAMTEWKEKDNKKKQDKRDRALQLAMELRKKKNAENFELSAKGGRANAKDDAANAKTEARDADNAAAMARRIRIEKAAEAKEQLEAQQTKEKFNKQRLLVKKKEQAKKHKSVKEYDARMTDSKEQSKMIQEIEYEHRKINAEEIRQQKFKVKDNKIKANPYAHRITQASIRKSRNYSERRNEANKTKQLADVAALDMHMVQEDDSDNEDLEVTQRALNGVTFDEPC